MFTRYRTRLILVAAVAAAVVLTTLANQLMFGPSEAHSDEDAASEVRISAKQLESGLVEFALQQRVDGAWGERVLPRQRFFPSDAEVGRWLNSSAVTLQSPAPPEQPMPRLCVVANGNPNKLFWRFVGLHAVRAAKLIGVELEYSTHPDVDERVAAIEECVEHGANMIVATLADADRIIPALHQAAEAGVKIATFGAGEEHADRADSLIHVSMNEAAAGRRAAEQFNRHGASGDVLCIVPHDAYEDRGDICEAVEDDYSNGHVQQVRLTSGDADEQIEALLTEHPDTAGLLVLEADLLPAALQAMQHSGVKPVLGSIGEYSLSKLSFPERDQITFMVMDLARFEVLLSAAALHLMYSNHPNARFFEGAMIFDGVPNVHTGGPKGGHGRPESTGDHGHDEGHDDNGHDDDGHDDDGHDDNGHDDASDDDHDNGH